MTAVNAAAAAAAPRSADEDEGSYLHGHSRCCSAAVTVVGLCVFRMSWLTVSHGQAHVLYGPARRGARQRPAAAGTSQASH